MKGFPSRTLGYSKNRTSDFVEFKNEIANKKKRFSKVSRGSSIINPKGESLLNSQNVNSTTGIELHNTYGLPPEWVDHFDHIKENLNKITILHKEIGKMISKRIINIFGKDNAELDNQIKENNQKAMKLLHECEEYLKKIAKVPTVQETDADRSIRKNIQRCLAQEITEKTVLLRKQQKFLYDKLKDSDHSVKSFNKSFSSDSFITSDTKNIDNISSDDIVEMEVAQDIGQERDAEINQLVDSMNELAHIFKQLNTLVIEQGHVLDRIDYNIEVTLQNTKKANKELKKAERAQDNSCAKKCIYILVMLITIFSVILVLKYKK